MLGGHVERVEAVHDGDNDHDERRANAKVQEAEEEIDGLAPAKSRVVGAQHALDENQVDDEEDDDACVGEDAGCDGDLGVLWFGGPDDAHNICDEAGHAEAKEESAEDEFVAASTVALEDGHVEDGAGDEDGG